MPCTGVIRERCWQTTCAWGFMLLLVDLFLYGYLVPVVGAYIGGRLSVSMGLNLGPATETVIIMVCVFCFLGFIFKGLQESKFWRHYFSGEAAFQRILNLRDALNTAAVIYFSYKLLCTVQAIIRDGAIKERNLHEAVPFVALRPFFHDDACMERMIGLTPPGRTYSYVAYHDTEPTSWDFSFSNGILSSFGFEVAFRDQVDHHILARDRAIHGAEFVLGVAMLTAVITKLIYFNSLYAYFRAMNIFICMQRAGELEEDKETEVDDDYGGSCIYDDDYEDECSIDMPSLKCPQQCPTDIPRRTEENAVCKQAAEKFTTNKRQVQCCPRNKCA